MVKCGYKPKALWVSKVSTVHRASRGTFIKQWRQITANHSSRAHSCRKTYLLPASLSSIHISRDPATVASSSAGNTVIMQKEIILLASLPEYQVCGYISWDPRTTKCRFSGSSQHWQSNFPRKKWKPECVFYAQNGAQELSLEGGRTGNEERASIHFPRTAEPRGGSPVTCTVALLVHTHFRPASLPPESVLGWKEIKRRQSNQKFSLQYPSSSLEPIPWMSILLPSSLAPSPILLLKKSTCYITDLYGLTSNLGHNIIKSK